MRKVNFLISLVVCLILLTVPAFGQSFKVSKGQVVYVPANHNYIIDDTGWRVVTRLIIRNVALNRQITVNSIELFGPDGLSAYVFEGTPVDLGPLESITYGIPAAVIPWGQNEGRPGFIVNWTASRLVSAPIIESATAIADFSGFPNINFQGVSFSPGRVLKEIWW